MDRTTFNWETLAIHTPLTKNEAIIILTLINPNDEKTISKIIQEKEPFNPVESYFDRLKYKLVMGKL